MHRVGHVQPPRCGPGVGGVLAGGVVVPHPAPLVHPHSVGPTGGRLSPEEGEAAERAEVLASGGVVPALHPAVPGWPPQRRARLLLPHGRQIPAPCVGAAGAAGVRPGGTQEEDLGVPRLQGLAHSGPLGPGLGASGARDGGPPDRSVPALVVGVSPPLPGPGHEVMETQEPGAQPQEGGQGADYGGPSPALVGGGEYHGGMGVPPTQKGEAMVPSPEPGE